jgi:copper homeostasis protein
MTLEVCAGDAESAILAEAGGADRVELCDYLAVGGTTPSAGVIAAVCRRLSIPVHVLIRPRGGDFLCRTSEWEAIRHDVRVARELGAAGIVIGALLPNATIAREAIATIADEARPLSVTFHKAFDQSRDLHEALETLIEIGLDRVLTSGGASTAREGTAALADLVRLANGRIAVMAGGGLQLEDLGPLVRATNVAEVHLGSAVTGRRKTTMQVQPRDPAYLDWPEVDPDRVRAVREALDTLRA